MADKKRLVVIDGKSVFYRGYYAMPNLATKDGTPTGGVYGFAVMALEVLKKMKPDYAVVAWDKPKTNIKRRREIYPAYKANRKPAPPDFYEQIPVLHRLLEAFNFPFYEIDDHEADDIMATFAKQAKAKGYETIMVTSDHDVLQMVDDDTVGAMLKKGLTNIDYFDKKRFAEKYQMTPDQFIDYKSLRGDPSDNIPGVAGVGEKTAIKLIEEYGSLDGVYEHVDEIKGSLQTKLNDSKDLAYITKKLVILDTNVPLKLDWENADVTKANGAKIVQILRDLEFRTLLNQLPDEMRRNVEEVKDQGTFTGEAKVIHVESAKDLAKLKATKQLVVHAVAAGPVNTDLKTLLVSPDAKTCYAINFNKVDASKLQKPLGEAFKDTKLVAHDAKYVLKSLAQAGTEQPIAEHDLQVAAFGLNSLSRDLSLAGLAHSVGWEGDSFDNLSPEDVLLRAGEIAALVWALYDQQLKDLKEVSSVKKLLDDIEWPILHTLADMEIEGVAIDTNFMAKMSERLADKIMDEEQEIYGLADQEFNISSPGQLADVLFGSLQLPTQGVKKGKTGYSTAATELDKLRDLHPIINHISNYRELSKLKSTYVDPLPEMVDENSRLHTTFSTWTAPTGRLSSHDPNLQNIPIRSEVGREIRQAFVAKPGHVIVQADYSQFELRLAAVLAGDDEMIEVFNDGIDIHARTAAQVLGLALEDVTKNQRRDAKVINFGILYGMSPHGLSVATGMSQQEAKDFIDRYFELRKPMLEYMEKTKRLAVEQGYVETMFGRRRPTPDTKSSNYVVREAALRAAINHPIQGTEADLMKMAMLEIDKKLAKDSKQILQIHDSIMVECPEDKAESVAILMKRVMESIYKLPVNLDVDTSYGKNWGEL